MGKKNKNKRKCPICGAIMKWYNCNRCGYKEVDKDIEEILKDPLEVLKWE